MLTRSPKAIKNIDVFYTELNDIDIYVEDTALEMDKMYNIIFQKVFNERYRISKVFSAGDKEQLERKFNELKACTLRKRIFIRDGDLDLFYPTPYKYSEHSQLHHLSRYCIENYLIEEQALTNFMVYESLTLDQFEAEKYLDFLSWKKNNSKPLLHLFKMYAISYKHKLQVPLVKKTVYSMIKDASGIICSKKVGKRVNHLMKALRAQGVDINQELCIINKHIGAKKCITEIVTAKDYLLPLIEKRLSMSIDTQMKMKILKLKLAQQCTFDELKEELKNCA